MDVSAVLVEQYGKDVKESLLGPGDSEAALGQPVTSLLRSYGEDVLGLSTYLHAEVREDAGAVRPDFGLKINGLMTGHVELKSPGTSLDPTTYGKTSHNFRQWRRLRNLPNLLHTDGKYWRLWRYGELVGEGAALHTTALTETKGPLQAPPSFYRLLTDFFLWKPTAITSIGRLIEVMAPLAAMLREEVLESLQADRRYAKKHNIDEGLRPFLGLKRDWRASLYPGATDAQFADGFAQTVMFSMIIALSEGTDLDGKTVPEIAQSLQAQHTLLGRSLDLLTEHIGESSVGLAIETIVRALSAVDWDTIAAGRQDVYLHLYENFLSAYDPELRKKSGSYYTPTEIVDAMTRLTDEALKSYLGVEHGLVSDQIAVIDPAMGTGTYPLSVLRHVAQDAEAYGAGAVADAVTSTAQRIYGIELQSGPFSVAELRLTQAVRDLGGETPEDGLNLYVADTLEDPRSGTTRELSYTLQLIAEQRRQANKMKLETPIQVCIGNPPYKDKAQDMGGWVEHGSKDSKHAPLDDFRHPDGGRYEYVLKNLYVYFWRWAMWKVFESIAESTEGVVCFITATGYLNGPGFKGMREWIRRNTSRGWIINLTPEGKQPPAKTAVFNIETEVAIGLFIRNKQNNSEEPAPISYTELHGTRQKKFDQLATLSLEDQSFVDAGTDWADGFIPAMNPAWADMPALNDLLPWVSPGVKPNKTWVYAPTADLLGQRWHTLVTEDNVETKRLMFRETSSTSIDMKKTPLPGDDVEQETHTPLRNLLDWNIQPTVARVGYRSFDRQHIIADSRVIERARPDLWAARIPGQIYLSELHSNIVKAGPGVTFSALIPDMDYFKGSEGGRALPLYHPDGSPNVALNLLESLKKALGGTVDERDLFAYIAGVSAHPYYVELFAEELQNYPNRVPLTADASLWAAAVDIGYEVIWLHTYGERGKPRDNRTTILDSTDGTLPEYAVPVGSTMPEKAEYDLALKILSLGKGRWTNVTPQVWNYTVGGVNVVDSWVGYRRKKPKGRKSSPLDEIILTNWTPELSKEFHELLVVLTQLVALEQEQQYLLDEIMESEKITYQTLQESGVIFPKTAKDRRPRMVDANQDPVF